MAEKPVSGATGSCTSSSVGSSCRAGDDDSNVVSNEETRTGEQQQLSEEPSNVRRAESEAVKLLDEELAELEQLMRLQRRKVDALERLRQQWLSGER